MKLGLLLLALAAGRVLAASAPDQEIIKSCVMTKASSPHVTYADIPLQRINEAEDAEAGLTETTIRFHNDEMGTWESSSHAFGLVYNGKRIPLDSVRRLSQEKPSAFTLSLAQWATITKHAKSYICVAFNFEGLGQSGSFQAVRGVYLIDRTAKGAPSFYTIGKVEAEGVELAK